MKLKLTHDKCDSSDVLIKLSLLSNIKKVYFLRYKRYLNRLCTFSRCLDTVNVLYNPTCINDMFAIICLKTCIYLRVRTCTAGPALKFYRLATRGQHSDEGIGKKINIQYIYTTFRWYWCLIVACSQTILLKIWSGLNSFFFTFRFFHFQQKYYILKKCPHWLDSSIKCIKNCLCWALQWIMGNGPMSQSWAYIRNELRSTGFSLLFIHSSFLFIFRLSWSALSHHHKCGFSKWEKPGFSRSSQ